MPEELENGLRKWFLEMDHEDLAELALAFMTDALYHAGRKPKKWPAASTSPIMSRKAKGEKNE